MQNKKFIAITLCLLFIFNFSIINTSAEKTITTFSTGKTLYVDDDADPGWYNETHFKRIQDAIDNASYGDIIDVRDGTYYEDVIVNQSICLIGENRENTIIESKRGNRCEYSC